MADYTIHLFIYYLSACCVLRPGAIIYVYIEGLASGLFFCVLKMKISRFLFVILKLKINFVFCSEPVHAKKRKHEHVIDKYEKIPRTLQYAPEKELIHLLPIKDKSGIIPQTREKPGESDQPVY